MPSAWDGLGMFGEGSDANLYEKSGRDSEMLSNTPVESYDLSVSLTSATFCPCALEPLCDLFDPQSLLL